MSDTFDPSLNIFHRTGVNLDNFFHPTSIAVIGATEKENSVGKTLMQNLINGKFEGTIYPINPKREKILGIKAYPSVTAVPEDIDLAVIVTPAKVVPTLIEQCVEKKIPTAVIISAGFKEMGEEGEKMEEQILSIARKGKMRIIGPNCLGLMRPSTKLNATFAADMALNGNIAFISQSGALLTAVLDWSLKEKVGFSAIVSIGSMVDVSWGDLINYLGSDPKTDSILLYMESIGDARAFLSAAREVALNKPIILIKAGRTEESAKAAASHTGSLAGSDDVLTAALKRVGVLRVDTIADLFAMASIVSKQPNPKGPHLAIITNAGGPGVIATDALVQNEGKIAEISPGSFEELNNLLPPHWSRNNPIDILGDATPETYGKVVDIVSRDPNVDGLLVILTPQDMTDPLNSAKEMLPYAHLEKPIFACWMGAESVSEANTLLNQEGIPTFAYPDEACKSFAYMWSYSYNLQGIYETPSIRPDSFDEKKWIERSKLVDSIIHKAREENREILTEEESKRILLAYEIPAVITEIATSKDEAVQFANQMGYPVVLKLFSETITHKTDVGGVKLNLSDETAIRNAFIEIEKNVTEKKGKEHFQGVTVQKMMKLEGNYEIIIGSSFDPQFGPTLVFGTGGQLVEVFQDRSLGLPPLTTVLARRMMEQTKIYKALQGVRGKKSVDLSLLEKILVRFSRLVVEQPWIKECDLNPLLASEEEIIALDARVILHSKETRLEEIPEPAIRPYPIQYISSWKMQDGTEVVIRPIIPEDEELIRRFHKDLSQETIRQRYLQVLHYDTLTLHERLIRICFNDYDRDIALVVQLKDNKEIIGVGRLSKIIGTEEAYFAIIIKDQWQQKGLGSQLLERLIQIAKEEKMSALSAQMLPENEQMQSLCTKKGFHLEKESKSGLIFAHLNL